MCFLRILVNTPYIDICISAYIAGYALETKIRIQLRYIIQLIYFLLFSMYILFHNLWRMIVIQINKNSIVRTWRRHNAAIVCDYLISRKLGRNTKYVFLHIKKQSYLDYKCKEDLIDLMKMMPKPFTYDKWMVLMRNVFCISKKLLKHGFHRMSSASSKKYKELLWLWFHFLISKNKWSINCALLTHKAFL